MAGRGTVPSGMVMGGDLDGVTQGFFELVRQHLDPSISVGPMSEGLPITAFPGVTR